MWFLMLSILFFVVLLLVGLHSLDVLSERCSFVFGRMVGLVVDRCSGFSVYVYFQLGIVPDYCEI